MLRDRFAKAFEVSTAAQAFTRLRDGLFLEVNPAWCAMFGFGRDELLGQPVTELGIWRRAEDRARLVHDLEVHGEVHNLECEFVRADGTPLIGLLSSELTDLDGEEAIVTSVVEISLRKRVEDALRASEERFRALVDQAGDAIFLHDEDGRLRDVNPAACAALGHGRNELLRLTLHEVEVGFDLHRAQERWATLEAGGSVTVQCEHRRRDGTTFPVELRQTRVEVAGERLVLGTAREISERLRAERELRRLAAAVEQAPTSVIITDVDGTVEYVNPAFERVSGFTRAEALGRNPRVLKSGVQPDAYYRTLWETISAGRVWEGRLVNRAKDGRLFTEDAVIAPVLDDAGAVRNYVAVKRDVSHELALQQSLAESRKLELAGRLAAHVADEFGASIAEALEGATVLLPALTDPALRDCAERIQRAAGRARELTRQLSSTARAPQQAPSAVDVGALLAGAEHLLRPVLGKDIRLRLQLAEEAWLVRAVPALLDELLVNLAVHARAAMPDGGELTLATENLPLGPREEHWRAHGPGLLAAAYLRLTVSDTGPALPPDVLGRVFEPSLAALRAGSTAGLELATAHAIVQQSGGAILARSQPGRGTCFEICLPRTVTDSSAAPHCEDNRSARTAPAT